MVVGSVAAVAALRICERVDFHLQAGDGGEPAVEDVGDVCDVCGVCHLPLAVLGAWAGDGGVVGDRLVEGELPVIRLVHGSPPRLGSCAGDVAAGAFTGLVLRPRDVRDAVQARPCSSIPAFARCPRWTHRRIASGGDFGELRGLAASDETIGVVGDHVVHRDHPRA